MTGNEPADRRTLDPPRLLRPDRPAADAGRGAARSSPTRRRTPSRRSSTACSPRRTTANAGAATGSTSRATPTPRDSATGGARAPFYPVRVDLPRLRHQGVQRRPAVRPVHPRAARRRPAGRWQERTKNPATLAALGFLTLGDHFGGNRHDVINDRIDVTSKAFLGLTVTCARCHDHKFDPIPTADYYSLYGIFASSVEPRETPIIAPPNAAHARLPRQAPGDGRSHPDADRTST